MYCNAYRCLKGIIEFQIQLGLLCLVFNNALIISMDSYLLPQLGVKWQSLLCSLDMVSS